MLFPKRFEIPCSGIFVDIGRCTGKAHREDIVPAVTVDVVDPTEKVIGVTVSVLRLGFVDLVTSFEVRSGEPVRAMDDVLITITVEVTMTDPLREINVRQFLSVELMDYIVLRMELEGSEKKQNEDAQTVPASAHQFILGAVCEGRRIQTNNFDRTLHENFHKESISCHRALRFWLHLSKIPNIIENYTFFLICLYLAFCAS